MIAGVRSLHIPIMDYWTTRSTAVLTQLTSQDVLEMPISIDGSICAYLAGSLQTYLASEIWNELRARELPVCTVQWQKNESLFLYKCNDTGCLTKGRLARNAMFRSAPAYCQTLFVCGLLKGAFRKWMSSVQWDEVTVIICRVETTVEEIIVAHFKISTLSKNSIF